MHLFYKETSEKCPVHLYSAHLCQYFFEPFAAITVASLSGFVSTSFAHRQTAISAHSSLQNSSSSVRLSVCEHQY